MHFGKAFYTSKYFLYIVSIHVSFANHHCHFGIFMHISTLRLHISISNMCVCVPLVVYIATSIMGYTICEVWPILKGPYRSAFQNLFKKLLFKKKTLSRINVLLFTQSI
jgi:hypothetical protein